MIRNGEPVHLRLVHSIQEEEVETPFFSSESFRGTVQRLFLPFSKETLWLRLLPRTCGGVKLYYVKIVALEDLRDYKPYLWVGHSYAEEIVLSRVVEHKLFHKLLRINPRNLVLHHVFKMQRALLKRDSGLQRALDIKEYFDREFGLSPRETEFDIHPQS
ncbi:MAG TPA: hypothetical protein VJQ25_01405 [Nitrospira sp.]|nr:hypothetical protein [Nitrospira sp.]